MVDVNIVVADAIQNYAADTSPVKVSLTNELIELLSDQLYQSPVKAIEELVVNSYDADATECRLYVPAPDDNTTNFVVLFDDGTGMDKDGLTNLWQIGRSNKRQSGTMNQHKRKLIGRFGIGKLATFAVANRLTYITKNNDKILSITIDFRNLTSSSTGVSQPIELPVREIDDWPSFEKIISPVLNTACINIDPNSKSWTIAILEDLKKGKTKKLTPKLLDWILSTAMPLASSFRLFLNCNPVVSSKESSERYSEFDVSDLPAKRLQTLKDGTGEEWKVEGKKLIAPSFSSGVTGTVIVTKQTLVGGKSDDIARSHGFFIRVRGRLVNTNDPLFVERALIHGVFNRFRADIDADDLDIDLKASRETFEESTLKNSFRLLLKEIFNEAVSRYETAIKEIDKGKKLEGSKTIVAPRLVEYPIADALIEYALNPEGTEADNKWFYLTVEDTAKIPQVAQTLYNKPRSKYKYEYTHSGSTERLVKFDPETSTFWINQDHELALEYAETQAKVFLEDFVTAEAMLEVYLREAQIPAHIAGEVLERRDTLLRSLAKDHTYSLQSIASALRSAGADERELEILLVVATRALGFVSSHISNAGEPDGIARFADYPQGETIITLEAKSSIHVPQLGAIDYAGLSEHMQDDKYKAMGCLLVAPNYPGSKSGGEDTAVANRANQLHISCWTVEQLARFIEVAESRQLNAKHLLDIVLNKFSPQDVSGAIDQLLSQGTLNYQTLYVAIINALRILEPKLRASQRTIDMIFPLLTVNMNIDVNTDDVTNAVRDLCNASKGGMQMRDKNILLYVSLDELERRVSGMTNQSGDPRRLSNFR